MERPRWMNHVYYPMLLMIFLLICASSIGLFFHGNGIPETNIVIVYILAVLLTSRYTSGYFYGILASIFATFAYNFLFTAPYLSFSVYDPNYFITFGIMTITALITSALTSRVKLNAHQALEKEHESRALYELTNQLSAINEVEDIIRVSLRSISDILNSDVGYLSFEDNRDPTYLLHLLDGAQINETCANVKDIKRYVEAMESGFYQDQSYSNWPIKGQDLLLGVIRIPNETAIQMDDSQNYLLQAMIENTALAMDRFYLSKQRVQAHEEIVQERYRSNLLRSISHDLRTPLSGIIGTSEMMMDMSNESDPRYTLAKEIHKDADWLHSMVENILSLTRLQNGKLIPNVEYEAIEEIVGSALYRVNQSKSGYEIDVELNEEVIMVEIDAKLIEQVVINLLENAIKHTELGNEIKIKIEKNEAKDFVIVSIQDGGTGIADEDFSNIFQLFYTTPNKHVDAKPGIGLGLTICDAIVKAHGGFIEARNREDGKGAIFSFGLPLKGLHYE